MLSSQLEESLTCLAQITAHLLLLHVFPANQTGLHKLQLLHHLVGADAQKGVLCGPRHSLYSSQAAENAMNMLTHSLDAILCNAQG